MKIIIILLVVLGVIIIWWAIRARSSFCPSCNKRINKNDMPIHLAECAGAIWYNLPIVPLSHIGALDVRIIDEKTYGIWDAVDEDWVRDFNNIVDDRVLKRNANKLLKLIKAKSKFNELVGIDNEKHMV